MHSTRLRIPALAAALILLGLLVPVGASADTPARGRILVPGDHVLPGGPISVVGSELDPGAQVVLRLASGATTIELGQARVGADGSLEASATVPGSFPLGYAELTVTDQSNTVWTAFVLIGNRAGPAMDVTGGPGDQAVWYGILGVGILIFILALVRYRQGRPSDSVRG